MPAATASSFLKPFDRRFTKREVDEQTYTLGRYTESERRSFFKIDELKASLKATGASDDECVEAVNARFLQLVLWDDDQSRRLLEVPDGRGGDSQFVGLDRLKEVLASDESHRAAVLAAALEAFPEYAASKKEPADQPPKTTPTGA